MLRIAICDDEEYFLEFEENMISNYLEACGITYQIDSFTSGRELLKALGDMKEFDIMFLDIDMEELNGIDTAREIRKLTRSAYLVFVTAYITYALDGYEVKAVRYIMKDHICFEAAMSECMDAIIQEMNYTEQKQNFKFREGNVELAFDDIMYVESNGHKLYFRVVQDAGVSTFTMYEKLDRVEGMLRDSFFCRLHQSYLVNLKYVSKVERYKAELRNGTRLNIAQPKYKEVSQAFLQYIGRI